MVSLLISYLDVSGFLTLTGHPTPRSLLSSSSKVARYCQEGFKAGVLDNCYDACFTGGNTHSFLTERRLDQMCDRALNDTPRPLCHDACVKGYRSGLDDMSISLYKLMAKASTHLCSLLRRSDIFRTCWATLRIE